MKKTSIFARKNYEFIAFLEFLNVNSSFTAILLGT